MRKTITGPRPSQTHARHHSWLQVERLAQVEVSSEQASHPIDNALVPDRPLEWRAETPGPQTIRILFDEPQSIRHVQILFTEERLERSQEFSLVWSNGEGLPLREIVRQQFNFSPQGATRELEDYSVVLDGVRIMELRINPDRSGGPCPATLTHLYFS